MRGFGALIPKWVVFINPPPAPGGAQESIYKKKTDVQRLQESTHNRTDAHTNTETLRAHIGPAQVQASLSPSTEMGKWTQASSPSLKNCLQLITAGQGKIIFIRWSPPR